MEEDKDTVGAHGKMAENTLVIGAKMLEKGLESSNGQARDNSTEVGVTTNSMDSATS